MKLSEIIEYKMIYKRNTYETFDFQKKTAS